MDEPASLDRGRSEPVIGGQALVGAIPALSTSTCSGCVARSPIAYSRSMPSQGWRTRSALAPSLVWRADPPILVEPADRTSAHLKTVIDGVLQKDPSARLVVDLQMSSFIDSAGFGVLITHPGGQPDGAPSTPAAPRLCSGRRAARRRRPGPRRRCLGPWHRRSCLAGLRPPPPARSSPNSSPPWRASVTPSV